MKYYHTHFTVSEDPPPNNSVKWVKYVLSSHFTDEETEALWR